MIGARSALNLSAGAEDGGEYLTNHTTIRAWFDETVPGEDTAWNDRRGAGPNLGPGAGSLGSGTRKGRQTIAFDGGDWLTATFANSQPFTRFAAIKFTTWTGATRVIFDGASTTVRLQRTAANKILIYAGTNLEATMSATLNDRWVVLAAVFNGANSSIWENGVLRASGAIGAANPTGITVGADNAGTQNFVGEMGELIGVSGALTTSQIARVSNYLQNKWV